MARDGAKRKRRNPDYSTTPLAPEDLRRVARIYERERARARHSTRRAGNDVMTEEIEAGPSTAHNTTVPSDLALVIIEGAPWQVDLTSGDYWPVVSDTNMSETGDGDSVAAARDAISNGEPGRSRNPPELHDPPAAGSPLSIGQRRVQSSGGPSTTQVQRGPTASQPPRETQFVPFTLHVPSISRTPSPTVQPLSGQVPDVSDSVGGQEPSVNKINNHPSREGSVTPTPGRPSETEFRTPGNSPSPPPRPPGSSRRGKQRRLEPYSDEETRTDGDDVVMEDDANRKGSRPATHNDILDLCKSFHELTREFIREVMAELRKGNARRANSTNYAADDESIPSAPSRRLEKLKSKYPGSNRRPPDQNAVSRHVRAHMKGLFHQDDWLKEIVDDNELVRWDPKIQECCTPQKFKLHLGGTPCSAWNASACRVFVGDFLATHQEIYPDVWAIRRVVLKKTQAYIKTLIRTFREKNRGENVKLAARQAKNRRERKTNLYQRRHDVTSKFWQMESQRHLLEVLGVDGMSSDEEETVESGRQYRILAPRWRSPDLTSWLRMFDVFYRYYRLEKDSTDKRGTMPRRRVATNGVFSSSRKFVAGLPVNFYRTEWLREQLDIANVVHPTEKADYYHDDSLVQAALQSLNS